MRISTAIALGRSVIKPKAGVHWDRTTNEGCAWGMVNAAAPEEYHYMMEIMQSKLVRLPCGCRGTIVGRGCAEELCPTGIWNVTFAIMHLFNFHVATVKDWTLDQLIDWVRTVEPADPQEVAAKAEEEMKEEVAVCP